MDRRCNFVIQRVCLIPSAPAFGTPDVSAIAAEQDAHMHLVSFALQPAKEPADAVPPIVFVVFFSVFAAALLAFDNEILIGLRQLFEGHIDIDLFASTGAE